MSDITHDTSQEWRAITVTDGAYEVSNDGYVKSHIKPRILKSSTKSRYLSVSLVYGGAIRRANIHRLVAEAFLPKVKSKEYVNHKDGNKHNNHVTNLEWVTVGENIAHAYRVLGRPVRDVKLGLHPQARSILQFDLNGKLIKNWDCAARAVKEDGYLATSIAACARGRIRHHKGYQWKYADDVSAINQLRSQWTGNTSKGGEG